MLFRSPLPEPRLGLVVVGDDDRLEPLDSGQARQTGHEAGAEGAHIVYAPERGSVGVVLLTALNVPSSKVYASL